MALFINIAAQQLITYERDQANSLGTDKVVDFPDSFLFWSGLNCILFGALVTTMHMWAALDDEMYGWNKWSLLIKIRQYFESKGKPIVNALTLFFTSLRSFQMIVIYMVISMTFGDEGLTRIQQVLTLFGILCLCDFLLLIPNRMCLAFIVAIIIWLFGSRASPASISNLSNSQKSYFEVIAEDNGLGLAYVWFDLVYFQMTVAFLALVLSLKTTHSRWKLWGMFVSFLDFATDLTVIAFWLSSKLWVWAFVQFVFCLVAALVQWIEFRHKLQTVFDHVLVLLGLGRGLAKLRVWNKGNPKWDSIDRRMNIIESMYESYPSLMFAVYLVTAENWRGHLEGNIVLSDLGPLFISVFITSISLATKSYDSSQAISVNRKLVVQCVFFVFSFSDFLVRCLPISLCFALAQGRTDNSQVSDNLILSLFLLMALYVSINAIAIKYWLPLSQSELPSCYEMTEQRSKLSLVWLLSVPSVVTVTPLLLACFQRSGLPPVLNLKRVIYYECVMVAVSVIIFIIPISIRSEMFNVLIGSCVGYLVSVVGCLATLAFLRTHLRN